MRIAPVNYSSNTQSKIQKFEGLWGKTSRSTDYDEGLGVPSVRNIYYYYPFSDESSENIQKVIDENSSARIENNFSRYRVNECRLCTTFPFTKSDYDNYMSIKGNDTMSKSIAKIHEYVQNRYLTKEFGNSQKTAVNDAVTENLKYWEA